MLEKITGTFSNIVRTISGKSTITEKNIEENTGKIFTSQGFIGQFKLIDENGVLGSEEDIKKIMKKLLIYQHYIFIIHLMK